MYKFKYLDIYSHLYYVFMSTFRCGTLLKRSTMKLRHIVVFLSLLIAQGSFVTAQTNESQDRVTIETLFKPETCDKQRKTQNYDLLTLDFVSWVEDWDTILEDSRESSEPLEFQLGIGSMMKGWDQGLLDMCVWEKRRVTVPPSLGMGEAKADIIPDDASLVFDFHLLDISGPITLEDIFSEIDDNGDKGLKQTEFKKWMVVNRLNNPDEPYVHNETTMNAEVRTAFALFDENGDRQVDWNEFQRFDLNFRGLRDIFRRYKTKRAQVNNDRLRRRRIEESDDDEVEENVCLLSEDPNYTADSQSDTKS